ncbi:MAG: PEP-CTERM sorting domain-containing protein [Rhodospirillaceae bacterium]|nr:PEP-CTERM sorting domain-containing protein [Rhodospirillales bacterium]
MRTFGLPLISAMLIFSAVTAEASPIIDQSNATASGGSLQSVGYNGNSRYQQQVTAGMAGLLSYIDLYAGVGGVGADKSFLRIAKLSNNNFFNGAWLFNSEISFITGLNHIDISAANINVAENDMFVIDVGAMRNTKIVNGRQVVTGSLLFSGYYNAYGSPSYLDGDMFTYATGASSANPAPYNQQLKFSTYVTPPPVATPVPAPATLPLFATGLVGVFAMARRRANKRATAA